jgi:hypothetical protein
MTSELKGLTGLNAGKIAAAGSGDRLALDRTNPVKLDQLEDRDETNR